MSGNRRDRLWRNLLRPALSLLPKGRRNAVCGSCAGPSGRKVRPEPGIRENGAARQAAGRLER